MTHINFLQLAIATLALASAPAQAKDGFDPWAEVSMRAVHSDRTVVDSDNIESSGIGASAEAGFEWQNGQTTVQFDLAASVFDYSDDTRQTRESGRATLAVAQEITETLSVGIAAGHWEDTSTLESREVDQDAIRGELKFENKTDRIRLRAQYRERRYETGAGGRGDGMRYDAQYNRRIGTWHWARIDLMAEDIDSDQPSRGFHRYGATAGYSLPIAKNLRFRPQLEYSRWKYDHRTVLDDPATPRRADSFVAPEVGLAYGGLTGLTARARAAWQFRRSNDPRYRDDAPYLEAGIAYRF